MEPSLYCIDNFETFSGKHQSLLKIATKEAGKSKEFYRVGCVIVKGSRVIGKGFNSRKTCPRFGYGPFDACHAETSAIKNALTKNNYNLLSDSSAYIVRLTKAGRIALAKPCEGCFEKLRDFDIQKIYYSNG